jgi:hypothetical protein
VQIPQARETGGGGEQADNGAASIEAQGIFRWVVVPWSLPCGPLDDDGRSTTIDIPATRHLSR